MNGQIQAGILVHNKTLIAAEIVQVRSNLNKRHRFAHWAERNAIGWRSVT
jgi:hypothetical protein